MPLRVDAIVIGAGVVGLACARRLSMAGLETVVLESEEKFGQGVSSRNSEVIHAGLYYQPGSWKARLCRTGRDLLYDYCTTHGVLHSEVGKWVVATSSAQVDALKRVAERARINGCNEISMLEGKNARRIEPQLRCEMAIDSPRTGIVDSHALMLSLLGDLERTSGALAVCSPVISGKVDHDKIVLEVGGIQASEIEAAYVVNSAGLDAPAVADTLCGLPKKCIPDRCYAKGSYFVLSGESPFKRLIYPVPETGGLGVHLTLDLEGHARFGPDVEWVENLDFAVDPTKAIGFLNSIKSYWPDCDLTRLQPGYAGIRPKLGSRELFSDDFVIQNATVHGIPGLINLFGIESPGLTSCLAIADEVAFQLGIP